MMCGSPQARQITTTHEMASRTDRNAAAAQERRQRVLAETARGPPQFAVNKERTHWQAQRLDRMYVLDVSI